MENIFVSESLLDVNHWGNTGEDFQRMKIGEIFQLRDSTLSMTCISCCQEFQYFTEFSLHIQEHFLRGDIARLNHIKEELPIETATDHSIGEPNILSNVKCEVIDNEFEEFFDNNSALDGAWSDDDFDVNCHSLFDAVESNVKPQRPHKKVNENQLIVEGTDYEMIQDRFKCLTCYYETAQWKHLTEHVMIHLNPKDSFVCPMCSKTFATISYVRKHVTRTHNKKITAREIKAAQPKSVFDVEVPEKRKKSHTKLQEKSAKKLAKKVYTEGVDYMKLDDKFQCLSCNRQMSKLDHMREHLLTHSSEKNVLCPFCATAFITESYVRKHVNRTHKMRITAEEIKAAQPSIDVSRIREEWAIEKDKQMLKQTSKSNTATAAATASGEGNVKCLFCTKLFTKPRYAQKHMRLIHAKSVSISDVVNCQPKHEKNDNDNNDQTFDLDLDLKMKIETQEPTASEDTMKHFECFECHKQFATTNSLRIHLKLHSGIKYSCPHCEKLFAMKVCKLYISIKFYRVFIQFFNFLELRSRSYRHCAWNQTR